MPKQVQHDAARWQWGRVSREQAFVDRLRALATHPAARGLADDAAVLTTSGRNLVLTHDMIVEGVHFLPADPPADVAWKLVAVNLSDLAAKGARPVGALLGYALGPDAAWDAAFTEGLREVLGAYDLPLLGGDTVTAPAGARSFGLTAIGEAPPGGAPSRAGARPGDGLWVTGTIGAAGLGLELARAGAASPAHPLAAYRRPRPRLAEGRALAPLVSAMCDVSDGLLIDASRIAAASGCAVAIDLDTVPFAPDVKDRLAAVTAGDDYELLFAAPAAFALPDDCAAKRIGAFVEGGGLTLHASGQPIAAPARLGYEH